MGYIFRSIGHTLPVCRQLRIFPIQSCTKFFVTEFSATIYCRRLIFIMKLYIGVFIFRSIEHTLLVCRHLIEFYLYSRVQKFFVTEFSATIYCRLLIFCMKHYICMMYRGIHFQIYRTYNFRLPTTDNFHRQCKIFRNSILGIWLVGERGYNFVAHQATVLTCLSGGHPG